MPVSSPKRGELVTRLNDVKVAFDEAGYRTTPRPTAHNDNAIACFQIDGLRSSTRLQIHLRISDGGYLVAGLRMPTRVERDGPCLEPFQDCSKDCPNRVSRAGEVNRALVELNQIITPVTGLALPLSGTGGFIAHCYWGSGEMSWMSCAPTRFSDVTEDDIEPIAWHSGMGY